MLLHTIGRNRKERYYAGNDGQNGDCISKPGYIS